MRSLFYILLISSTIVNIIIKSYKICSKHVNLNLLILVSRVMIICFLSSSKSHLNVANKNEKCSSTFIVKADVHRTDNSDIEPAIKLISDQTHFNKKCSKSELDFSTVDDIHILASESLFSPQTAKQNKLKREKPWSLRIKLQSSENNDSSNGMY